MAKASSIPGSQSSQTAYADMMGIKTEMNNKKVDKTVCI